ncbi:MAG: LacI family DNA-binding transcriptional regulator [Phycisphaerae bacterium]
MRKVTIEDVSRDTGLSRGTVSRALNDRPDISTRTKQRVLEACQKLNYVPSHAARSLATGRNYAVTVLVDDLRSAFSASFLRGVINRAQEARYAVHVVETGAEPQPDRLRSFSPERIDGVLNAVPLDASLAGQLRQIVESRVLTSCWPLKGVSCDVLTPDQREAGRMVARLLVGNGSLEILYVHRPTSHAAAERLAGFQEVCRERGLDPESVTATIADLDTLDTLSPRLERADAIVAIDDFLAVTIMLLCARLGRRAGEDFAVIGHGNEPVGSAIRPSLTTVDFNGEEIGRRTMETVLQRLAQRRMDAPQHTRIAPLLVQRASTRQFAR